MGVVERETIYYWRRGGIFAGASSFQTETVETNVKSYRQESIIQDNMYSTQDSKSLF